jgi:septum site-determining protein MinD
MNMGQIWLVASGKGGTGKSSLVVNVGSALAVEGFRVLLVDLSLGLRCLDLCLGMDDRVLFDLMDVMEGSCRPSDAILRYPKLESLWLLPAAQNRSMKELDEKRLRSLCVCLSADYDYILLDCPPGLEPIPVCAASVAGRGILVTTTEAAAIRDTDRAVAEFSAQGLTDVCLVINRFRSDYLTHKIIPSGAEISDSLGLPLLGTVPEDEAVSLSTLSNEPVVLRQPAAPSAKAYSAMARRLTGKDFS